MSVAGNRHGRRGSGLVALCGLVIAVTAPAASAAAPTGRLSLDLQQNLRIDTGIPAVAGQRTINVAALGDVNGDGRSDLAVAMPGANSRVGRGWILFGPAPDALDSRVDSEIARRLDVLTAPGSGTGFAINGAVALGQLGVVLSTGGDVNGDGKADVLLASTTSTFVVFGKADDAPVAVNALGAGGFEIQNTGNGINLATAIAGGRDVNGDGLSDILVADAVADRRGGGVNENSGSAWLVFGKATTTPVDVVTVGTAGFEIRGAAAGDTAGSSVAFTPDMSGDGRAEILVGAANRDDDTGTAGREGAAYVVHGRATPGVLVDLATIDGDPTDQGFEIRGPHQLGSFAPRMGAKVAGADINGDGLGDAVVAAVGWNPPGALTGGGRGGVFVIFGRGVTTTVANDQGAVAGNIGADGYRIEGERESDFIGTNGLATTNDVNGDGRSEIMFSANGPNGIGTAHVVYGKASTTTIDQNTLLTNGFALETTFNPNVTLLGVTGVTSSDVNSDGLTDFVVASGTSDLDPIDADPLTAVGSVFVVYGRPDTPVVDLATTPAAGRIDGVVGPCATDIPARAGDRLVSGGDVNGDGRPDLLIAAPEANTLGRSANGAIYVVFGVPSLGGFDLCGFGPRGFRIDGAATADRIGNSSANTVAHGGVAAGDVNGDGLSDIIIGAKSIAGGSGRAYVVFGKATTTPVDLATFPQTDPAQGFRIDADPALAAFEGLGSGVASAGDLNGDGRAEVAIGAPTANADFSGRVYVIDGKTTGATVALPSGWTIDGDVNDQLGLEVTSIGDQNGDGRRDLAFGGSAQLIVFARPGQPPLDATGGLAPDAGYRLARVPLSSALGPIIDVGNMVGDATPDYVLTGATGPSGSEAPLAVVVPGSSVAPTLGSHPAPGLRIDGVPGDGPVTSGANVGDLNQDGRSDLVLGIQRSKAAGRVDGGAAYVVFGKPGSRPVHLGQLGTEGVRYDGAAASDEFGTGVAALGDRTADGVADVAISAPFTAPQAGTTYLINGLSSDRIAPGTTITGGPTGTISSPTATLTFSSTEPGVAFVCSLDGGPFTPCTSPHTITGLTNGTHTVQVRAVDKAGNTDPTPASITFTVAVVATPDTAAPVLSFVSLSRTTFAAVGVPSKRKPAPKRGTVIRWTLSEAATTTLRFERILPGRTRGSVCVAGRKVGRRCTAFRLIGTVTRNGVVGRNAFTFTGRLSAKALVPGRYRVVLRAHDPAGNVSTKTVKTFTVIR